MRFGDQLKLESVKTQGQYLHVSGCSQGAAGYNVLPDKYDTYTCTTICMYSVISKKYLVLVSSTPVKIF